MAGRGLAYSICYLVEQFLERLPWSKISFSLFPVNLTTSIIGAILLASQFTIEVLLGYQQINQGSNLRDILSSTHRFAIKELA